MPIVRTFQCPECFHRMEVTLTMEQADDPPPDCPRCNTYDLKERMQQQFKAPGIINSSPHSRAQALADDILRNDYHVSDINRDRHEGSTPKVRYKDTTDQVAPSNWGAVIPDAMSVALNNGRQVRQQSGSGLDMLHGMLKSGAQKDLIEVSKGRSIKIW